MRCKTGRGGGVTVFDRFGNKARAKKKIKMVRTCEYPGCNLKAPFVQYDFKKSEVLRFCSMRHADMSRGFGDPGLNEDRGE